MKTTQARGYDQLQDILAKTKAGAAREDGKTGRQTWNGYEKRFGSLRRRQLNVQHRARNDMERKLINMLLSHHFYSINQCET